MQHTARALTRVLFAFCLTAPPALAQLNGYTLAPVYGHTSAQVDLAFAPADPTRTFVVTRTGLIRVAVDEQFEATPFLDLRNQVSTSGERGLLGLAFHPQYDQNGRFFVCLVDTAGVLRVSEYGVSSNPNVADPTLVQDILTLPQINDYHNAGRLRFGPDGKLYVAIGDGGLRHEAQDGSSLRGKIHRLDVDLASPFIPPDNPFVGDPNVRDETYHLGLRNPWQFSFDRATGDMWIADVGWLDREEIDFAPAGVGGLNFGWPCMEGTLCHPNQPCTCNAPHLTPPVYEYQRDSGRCAVTGGFVYRGSALPALQGAYFFLDLCSGEIWSLRYDGSVVTELLDWTAALSPPSGPILFAVSIAENHAGELHVLPLFGSPHRIVAECGWTSYCDAAPNASGAPASIGATGSTELSRNDLTLTCSSLPATTAGIFFYGSSQVAMPSGNGTLCVSGSPLTRLYPAAVADASGFASRLLDLSAPPIASGPGAVVPGVTVNFQFWFRDSVAGAPTWNFSDGLEVQFCP